MNTLPTSIEITKLGDSEAAAIAAFEVYGGVAANSDVSELGGRMLRIKMVDQLRALELYGRAMGYPQARRFRRSFCPGNFSSP